MKIEQFGNIQNEANFYLHRDVVTGLPGSKILLLHVTPERYYQGAFGEPLGIEQLTGSLIESGIPINISLGVIRNPQGVSFALDAIQREKPGFVGISMPIGALEDTEIILDAIAVLNETRASNNNAQIEVYLGGNLPTNLPENYLTALVHKYPFATVIRGWGDNPLITLMDANLKGDKEAKEGISGLIWFNGQEVRVNPLSVLSDEAPKSKPRRLLVKPEMQAFVEASRNCSHPYCTFCARMPYFGKETWSPIDPKLVVEQMAELSALGVRKVSFTDEEALGTTVNHAVESALPLALAIQQAKKSGKIDLGFGFAFSTRSDSIIGLIKGGRLDVMEELREAGLARVYLGIESGVPIDFVRWDGFDIPPQTRRYGKGVGPEQHLQAIGVLNSLGIDLEIGFIPFDPLLDLGEMSANAKFLLENDLARHASDVFNSMRLQSGAKYVLLMDHALDRLVAKGQLIEKPELLGEYNPSILKTDYHYLHPLVGSIVKLVSGAAYETHAAMYTLKSFYRTRLVQDEASLIGYNALVAIRNNDLGLLVGVVNSAKELLKGRGIPLKDYDQLATDFSLQPEVQKIVEGHRSTRDTIWSELLISEIPHYLRSAIEARLADPASSL